MRLFRYHAYVCTFFLGCSIASGHTLAQATKPPAKSTIPTKKVVKKVAANPTAKPTGAGLNVWVNDRLFGLSLGMIKGSYSDKQIDEKRDKTGTTDGVKLAGTRIQIKWYSQKSSEGLLEMRQEKPGTNYWSQRTTTILTAGYVLPWLKVISLNLGGHMSKNKIDLSTRDGPEAAENDILALIVGLHARQKLFSLGDDMLLFFGLKLHELNPGLANKGREIEATLGMSMTFMDQIFDLEFGMLNHAHTSTEDDDGKLEVESKSSLIYFGLTSWIWKQS